MEDVAVYSYITPLKVKIILALALTDSTVKDLDIIAVRGAFFFNMCAKPTHPCPDLQGNAYGLLYCHFQPLSPTRA
jgi:hypothetical protein